MSVAHTNQLLPPPRGRIAQLGSLLPSEAWRGGVQSNGPLSPLMLRMSRPSRAEGERG